LSVFNRAFPRTLFEELVVELRWLGSCLGPARDWDVFATETLPVVCAAFPSEAGLHWLTERTAELRSAADSSAREAVASARYTVLLLRLTGIFARAVGARLTIRRRAARTPLPISPPVPGAVTEKVLKGGHSWQDGHGRAVRFASRSNCAMRRFSALYNKARCANIRLPWPSAVGLTTQPPSNACSICANPTGCQSLEARV
jgi:hypothetical protein